MYILEKVNSESTEHLWCVEREYENFNQEKCQKALFSTFQCAFNYFQHFTKNKLK